MIKFIRESARGWFFTMLTMVCICAQAQIGYQVSLLNTATGEPRANESVNVMVKITDNEGKVICEEKKKETTNDFGVLSMTVGNSDTFAEADWSNLPFFIEATVDDRLIGRSQILSVPVAEYAKRTGLLTKEILCSKTWEGWDGGYKETLKFNIDGTYTRYIEGEYREHNSYEIFGGTLIIFTNSYGTDLKLQTDIWYYLPSKKWLINHMEAPLK